MPESPLFDVDSLSISIGSQTTTEVLWSGGFDGAKISALCPTKCQFRGWAFGTKTVKSICVIVGRFKCWFHHTGGTTIANLAQRGSTTCTGPIHHTRRISRELERSILSIRRRLQTHASSATRYCLIRDAAPAELKALTVHKLPCV